MNRQCSRCQWSMRFVDGVWVCPRASAHVVAPAKRRHAPVGVKPPSETGTYLPRYAAARAARKLIPEARQRADEAERRAVAKRSL